MKKIHNSILFALMLSAILFAGCAVNSTFIHGSQRGIVVSNELSGYTFISGDYINSGQWKPLRSLRGDTVALLGSRKERFYTSYSYLMVDKGGDSAWVNSEDILTLCDIYATEQNPHFFVSAEDDKLFWGRAQYYVNSHSDMKQQNVNDYIIETYNPTQGVELLYSYKILKEPLKNGFMYRVNVVPSNSYAYQIANAMARKCAYYITTGNCDL